MYHSACFGLIILENEQLTEGFDKLLYLLKPYGILYLLCFVGSETSILQELKLSGFISSRIANNTTVTCQKPMYETGSAVKLSYARSVNAAAVWKIDDDEAVDDDLINEDDLLDEKDKKKPNSETLKDGNQFGRTGCEAIKNAMQCSKNPNVLEDMHEDQSEIEDAEENGDDGDEHSDEANMKKINYMTISGPPTTPNMISEACKAPPNEPAPKAKATQTIPHLEDVYRSMEFDINSHH
uniref:Uncharacterized protein n=1 Tax=Glossina morsitans morsitans TaxID=37546 RepID=A0A1B0G2C7_GLOMM